MTVSTAVRADNPEVVEARRRGIPVLARAETLAAIAARKRCIAVAGTHGKTTTASMLSLILVEAGMRPSFLIGGEVNEIGTNAVWDSGEWIVVEADESDGTFLHLVPEIAVVTNVEADHLDHYGSFEARARRLRRVPGFAPATGWSGATTPRHWCHRPGRGRRPGRAVRRRRLHHRIAVADRTELGRLRPARARTGTLVTHLQVAVPGLHNAKNAAVATVAALAAGAPSRGRRPGAGPVRWRGPPVRVPGRAGRRHLRRRLRPPAHRGPRRAGRRPQRRLGPGGGRVPTPPLLADGRRRRGSSAMRSTTPTWWW